MSVPQRRAAPDRRRPRRAARRNPGAMPRAGDGAAQAGLPGLRRRGCAGAGAEVLVKKHADHLPLYRQSQIMARHGVILDRATLANWVGAAAARLKPLVELMKAELLTSARLFVDETTAKVLAPGTGKTKVGYTWAAKLLGDYHGILQVDGYEAYRQFGKADRPSGPATLAYCWAE
jgi:transposase